MRQKIQIKYTKSSITQWVNATYINEAFEFYDMNNNLLNINDKLTFTFNNKNYNTCPKKVKIVKIDT
jgi:hypothetical protein